MPNLRILGRMKNKIHFTLGSHCLKRLAEYEDQEISTHTFSHFYCLEEGQTAEQFEADLIASLNVSSAFGHPAKSIVFPRNQLNKAYLPICKKHGIESFRGNEKSWIYQGKQIS